MCDKIHYYQKAEQRKRQIIHLPECQKQKRGEIRGYRLCNKPKITRDQCFLVILLFRHDVPLPVSVIIAKLDYITIMPVKKTQKNQSYALFTHIATLVRRISISFAELAAEIVH